MNSLNQLEETIGYSFKDKSLLELALTHSSYLQRQNLKKTNCNERLEFIGDGLLDSIIGCHLYMILPDVEEGELTKVRASIVCEKSLASIGREINLSKYIKLGKGEEVLGGRDKDSITADALEALIGACFLDSGYETVEKIVINLFGKTIDDGINHKLISDYKTYLQEIFQKRGTMELLKYVVVDEKGPSHNKTFYVNLYYNNQIIGSGVGKKKKDAEQAAAKEALEKGGLQ